MRRAFILLFAVAAAPTASAPAPADAAATVWAVPSIRKVRPDDPVERANRVWSAETRTVSVAGARGEHVPFQLVVTVPPPPNRHERAAAGFFVEASDLVSERGRIARERVEIFLEHVVLCYARSSPIGATGFWPDALAPLTDPFGMAAEFRSAVRNRALWVDVVVPPDAPAGEYRGTLRITRDGSAVDELTLRLRVYGFTLPAERHLITYMGVSSARLLASVGAPSDSPEQKHLARRYYDFLYDRRMEPWFHEPLQPEIRDAQGDEVTLVFDDAEYEHYMNARQARRVVLEAAPGRLRNDRRFAPFSDGFNRRLRSYLHQVVEYYRRRGWLPRLVFNSPIDEPATSEHYADTRRYAELVHEAAPGVPFLATKAPLSDHPELGTLAGYVNHFSVHGNALNRLDVRKAIGAEQARGGEATWYISCDQVYPQPNYFIDAPAMDPVMVPWITARLGLNGILYWAVNYWQQTADPWLDPVTYLSGFLCSRGGVLNGEGSLVYPGNRTRRHTGQRDVDGPVSSLRLELLREGLEDYEVLWLLRSVGEGELADSAIRSLAIGVGAFSRSADELFDWREKMSERLEARMGGNR